MEKSAGELNDVIETLSVPVPPSIVLFPAPSIVIISSPWCVTITSVPVPVLTVSTPEAPNKISLLDVPIKFCAPVFVDTKS